MLTLRLCYLGDNGLNISNYKEKERMEKTVNKHEGVEIFYDEVCRENKEEGG